MKTDFQNPHVSDVFHSYPAEIRDELLFLRELIYMTASEMNIDDLTEELKWGEPSYLTRNGSTVRLAWRKSRPHQYGIFFNCKTSLVETFREVYQDFFRLMAIVPSCHRV